jgi:hypothetical protein
MKARSLFVSLVLVCLWGSLAGGDLLPFPGAKRPPRPQPGPQPTVATPNPDADLLPLARDVQIKLEAADVNVRLSRQQQVVRAVVTCRFELLCVDARYSPVTFAMAFPVATDEDQGVQSQDMTVAVNGKPQKSVRPKQWPGGTGADQKRTYRGYAFPGGISRGARQTVDVSYTVLLPIRDNAARFHYVLRSGAVWYGPIGRETVQVTADKGLSLAAATSPQFRPAKESAGELVWQINRADPTEDVFVAVKVNGAN